MSVIDHTAAADTSTYSRIYPDLSLLTAAADTSTYSRIYPDLSLLPPSSEPLYPIITPSTTVSHGGGTLVPDAHVSTEGGSLYPPIFARRDPIPPLPPIFPRDLVVDHRIPERVERSRTFTEAAHDTLSYVHFVNPRSEEPQFSAPMKKALKAAAKTYTPMTAVRVVLEKEEDRGSERVKENVMNLHNHAYGFDLAVRSAVGLLKGETAHLAFREKINHFEAVVRDLKSNGYFFNDNTLEAALKEYFLDHLIDEAVKILEATPGNFINIDTLIFDSLVPFAQSPFGNRAHVNIAPTPFVLQASNTPVLKTGRFVSPTDYGTLSPFQTHVSGMNTASNIHHQLLSRYVTRQNPDLNHFAYHIGQYWTGMEAYMNASRYHDLAAIPEISTSTPFELFFFRTLNLFPPDTRRTYIDTYFPNAAAQINQEIRHSIHQMRMAKIGGNESRFQLDKQYFGLLKNKLNFLTQIQAWNPEEKENLIWAAEAAKFNPETYEPSREELASYERVFNAQVYNFTPYLLGKEVFKLVFRSKEGVIAAVKRLDSRSSGMSGRFLGKVFELGTGPNKGTDPQWAENNLTIELGMRALQAMMDEDISLLAPEQRNVLYGKIYDLAEEPKGGERWGEINRFQNMHKFFEAYHATLYL